MGDSSDTLTVGLTSCGSGEGVSTVAGQLALTAASVDCGNILLVEGNFRRPSFHKSFCVSRGPGLAEVLLGDQPIEIAVRRTSIPSLSILPAGDQAQNAAHLLVGERVKRLLQSVENDYSLIVFDMPSLSADSTTVSWAGCLDAVLLVVEAEQVRWEVARRAKENLRRAGGNVYGTVLNKWRKCVPNWLARIV